MSTADNYTTINTIMKGFVNDGALQRAIEQRNFFPQTKIIFVSFDTLPGVLRILIGGACPVCHSRHMRNICNQKYTNECTLPIMARVFPIINDIRVVRSTDPDLDAIVKENNGLITTPYSADETMPCRV